MFFLLSAIVGKRYRTAIEMLQIIWTSDPVLFLCSKQKKGKKPLFIQLHVHLKGLHVVWYIQPLFAVLRASSLMKSISSCSHADRYTSDACIQILCNKKHLQEERFVLIINCQCQICACLLFTIHSGRSVCVCGGGDWAIIAASIDSGSMFRVMHVGILLGQGL